MTTKSAPIFSLQAPKDVSIHEINAELSKIWTSYNASGNGKGGPTATRAETFSLTVYEPDETQQLLATLGFYTGPMDGIYGPRMEAALRSAQAKFGLTKTGKLNSETLEKLRQANIERQIGPAPGESYALDAGGVGIADAVVSQSPCRVISLFPRGGEDNDVSAQLSAYCPVKIQHNSSLTCCEYISLIGTEKALDRVGGLIQSLMISELPKFLWWKAVPAPDMELFQRLATSSTAVILDSSQYRDVQIELINLQHLITQGINIIDLNWRRLAAWQELTAEAFDPPARRVALSEVDRVTIDYEKGNPAQALMFLGWLASRLRWQPVAFTSEGGDYDLKRIQFITFDQRKIEAELASIPTQPGEVAGDLIDLKLASTNLQADCCTVLCSETRGCMRMEAGGGAQSCWIQHVTPLHNQSSETLLSQQLQRWDQDILYIESLEVTAKMLKLESI